MASDRYWWKLKLVIFLVVNGAIAFRGNSAFAQVNSQIAPDSTLGAEKSIVTPDVLNGIPIDQIDGGAKRGINLFHSFQEFNVDVGKGVYFQNLAGIENILSRVTGNNPSRILGKLGVLTGNANLFLINPQGIIFGAGGSLDVGGSFVATTANAIHFGNQGFFSASVPNTPPTLTVNPSALLFNQIEVGSIINNSRAIGNNSRFGLGVPEGRSLLLVGGDVNFDSGVLDALGGRVELGGVAGEGTVGLSINGNNLSLSYPQEIQLANIFFTNVSLVRATGSDVDLKANIVKLSESSQILSNNQGDSPVGNLTVNASESVEIMGSRSSLASLTTAAGDAGNIIINTRRLLLEDGAFVTTDSTFFAASSNASEQLSLATGRAGNLTVNASDSVELKNSSLTSQTQGSGDAGNITLNTTRFILRDDATVSAQTFASGQSGNIILQAQDVLLQNQSNISTSAGNPGTPGNGGNITIKADTLVGVENSNITANAFNGRGGRIRIDAQGIFGLEVIDTINDINELEDNNTSDISASSRRDPSLNGEVEINRPETDISSGLVILPTELVDVSGLIAQGCSAGGGNVARGASKFVATGRGGLPPTPTEALRSDAALADLGTSVQGDRASATISTNPTNSQPTPIVEAQGWVIGPQGEVVLTAHAPSVTPDIPWLPRTSCNGF